MPLGRREIALYNMGNIKKLPLDQIKENYEDFHAFLPLEIFKSATPSTTLSAIFLVSKGTGCQAQDVLKNTWVKQDSHHFEFSQVCSPHLLDIFANLS